MLISRGYRFPSSIKHQASGVRDDIKFIVVFDIGFEIGFEFSIDIDIKMQKSFGIELGVTLAGKSNSAFRSNAAHVDVVDMDRIGLDDVDSGTTRHGTIPDTRHSTLDARHDVRQTGPTGPPMQYTATESTNYFFDVESSHLEGALDRFSQFFQSPLFSASSMERELQAVDSEHSNNKLDDTWRLFQVCVCACHACHGHCANG